MQEQYKVTISYKESGKLLPNGDEVYECISTTSSGESAAINGARQTLGLLEEDQNLLCISCCLADPKIEQGQ